MALRNTKQKNIYLRLNYQGSLKYPPHLPPGAEARGASRGPGPPAILAPAILFFFFCIG